MEVFELFVFICFVVKDFYMYLIDEVWVIFDIDLVVYELGFWREKLSDRGKWVFILGVVILKDFQKEDFKVVFVYEYGYFMNCDIVGGGVVMCV